MPSLNRAPNEKELQKLIEIFLRAETDIINEIGRLRSMGNVDYHAVAALERVQAILKQMANDAWTYSRPLIEKQFYVRVPEARKILEPVEKHISGYGNAAALTSTQMDIVQKLVMNLMGQINEAAGTTMNTLQNALLGRTENDIYRRVGLEMVSRMQASGKRLAATVPEFVETLRREGVTAFVDKAGRNWSLHTYGSMVCRTTSRQAEVLAVLTADPDHDLYKISSHGTTCKLCAPFEGRVYSRSGTDPDFPPLSAAFGKIDPNGPDDLSNTYLNLHPGCLHVLLPWTAAGRTPEEIQKIKDFSDPKKNPFTRDPRTEQQIAAYRKKEQARAKWLADYRQWEKYRTTLGDKVPKTFQTFQKHKLAGDEKYKDWLREYKDANELEKYKGLRHNDDGTVVVTDHWKKHRNIPAIYKPNAVVETHFEGQQVNRIYYASDGKMALQVHSGDHGFPKRHPYGAHGEHQHNAVWDGKSLKVGKAVELTEEIRLENMDILEGGL